MKKQYENCGPTEILGHSPGVTFTADLSEFQEKTLIEGGGLKVIGEVPPDEETTDTPEDSDEPVVEEQKTPPGESPDEKPTPPPPLFGGKGRDK